MFKIVALTVLAAILVNGEPIYIQNQLSITIVVKVINMELILLPGLFMGVNVGDNWNGEIQARNQACVEEVCSEVATVVEFVITKNYTQYDISLVKGFNLPVKVITSPKGSCNSISCSAQELITECPLENQVSVNGNVVACQLSPDLFNTYCSSAIVDSVDNKTVTCPPGTIYNVSFDWA